LNIACTKHYNLIEIKEGVLKLHIVLYNPLSLPASIVADIKTLLRVLLSAIYTAYFRGLQIIQDTALRHN